MGEGYKTQNRAVWFQVVSHVHTTFHCVTVICVLTSQFLHRGGTGETGKVWEVPDPPHSVCSELAARLLSLAGYLPFPWKGHKISPQNAVNWSHLSPFDMISRHVELEKSIHGWSCNILIGRMAQWGIPSSQHGANAVSPGKKEQKGPTGPLRHFLASPLPKTWMTHLQPLFGTGKPSQYHSLTFKFTHVFP